jgi:hypothetical protein
MADSRVRASRGIWVTIVAECAISSDQCAICRVRVCEGLDCDDKLA